MTIQCRSSKPAAGGVLVQNVAPEVDAGEFPIKRIVGQTVRVAADAIADGHDQLSCVLKFRKVDEPAWSEVPMEPMGNDRWQAEFGVPESGRYRYTVEAWVDHFESWRERLQKHVEAGQDVAMELRIGADFVHRASQLAGDVDATQLQAWAEILEAASPHEAVDVALGQHLRRQMARHSDRRLSTVYPRELEVLVERQRAAFGAWYEMFPRSCSPEPGRHGTLRDCEARLPYLAEMGFDVLYLPPIHPIGHTYRKGSEQCRRGRRPDDPGSPGRSARRTAGTRRSTRNWERWPISTT